MTERNSENYRVNELEVYAGAGALAQADILNIAEPGIADEGVPVGSSNLVLRQNVPNPFNPETRISFTLPQDTHVSIRVYNLLGAEVATVIDEPRGAGDHQVVFHPGNLSSGVYFFVLNAGNERLVRRMMLTK
jgi:hypothetical protein